MKVVPLGSRSSKIALIGEAPGKEEDLCGVPFVGSAGKRLNSLLYAAGIDRSQCYIDNVVQTRPPDNKIHRLSELGISLEEEKSKLISRLNSTSCNVIVPLGGTALEALFGKRAINKYRGSILVSSVLKGQRKLLPTFHPSYLQRIMGYASSGKSPSTGDVFLSYLDYLKIARESKSPEVNLPQRKILVNPSFVEVLGFLRGILAGEYSKVISVDIEAFYGATPIKCIGIGVSAELAFVIPIFSNKPWWSIPQEKEIWELISKILADPKILKFIQNEQYERLMLFDYCGEIINVFDLMLGQRLLFPELKLSLATQASIFTDEPYFKDDAKNANYTSEALWNYNGKDCTVTHEIGIKQKNMLAETKLDQLMNGLSIPMSRIMWKASHVGVRVDTSRVKAYTRKLEEQIELDQAKLDTLVGRSVNVKSTKQLGILLYDEMNIPKKIKKVSGSITTDIAALEELSIRYPSQILQLIIRIRKSRDNISKNLGGSSSDPKPFWDSDSRIRPNWLVPGTETGRLSCTKNIFGRGLSLQCVPAGKKSTLNLRDIYIADEDHSFIVFDASQIEARLVAYLAESTKLMAAFENGLDVYSLVASQVFNKPIEVCCKGTSERDNYGKPLVLGANYGLSAQSFGKLAKIPTSKARTILQMYLTMFGIVRWQEKTVEALRKDRTLVTPFGRSRLFNGHWGEGLFKEAYAFIPQSTAVDWMNLCGVRIDRRIAEIAKSEKDLLLIQDHDEWVLQVEDSLIPQAIAIVKEECSVPIKIYNREVFIPIELTIGKDWKNTSSHHRK